MEPIDKPMEIRQLGSDLTRQDRRDFCRLHEESFSKIPDMSPNYALHMAWDISHNQLDALRRAADRPDVYLAMAYSVRGNPIGAARIGYEKYGDRPDRNWLHYQLARAAYKLNIQEHLPSMQIFSFGADCLDDGHRQKAFNGLVASASGYLADAKSFGAFVDNEDPELPTLIRGFDPSVNPKVSGKDVNISIAGISRPYHYEGKPLRSGEYIWQVMGEYALTNG
ncbi:hypothetical protein CR969_01585 [Candidatus Saccharibacteria bacterium]|nr:MAG: hypothetical protein CR969_01585 [Candidatus Saccharibacteria bacterium]